jgi:hypothetical protein
MFWKLLFISPSSTRKGRSAEVNAVDQPGQCVIEGRSLPCGRDTIALLLQPHGELLWWTSYVKPGRILS